MSTGGQLANNTTMSIPKLIKMPTGSQEAQKRIKSNNDTQAEVDPI